MGETRGWPRLDKAVLPCGTSHRTHGADISHPPPLPDHKKGAQQPSTHPPAHKSTWHHSRTRPLQTHMTPSRGPHNAPLRYRTGTAKPMLPKQTPKYRDGGSPCLHRPVLGQGAGGTAHRPSTSGAFASGGPFLLRGGGGSAEGWPQTTPTGPLSNGPTPSYGASDAPPPPTAPSFAQSPPGTYTGVPRVHRPWGGGGGCAVWEVGVHWGGGCYMGEGGGGAVQCGRGGYIGGGVTWGRGGAVQCGRGGYIGGGVLHGGGGGAVQCGRGGYIGGGVLHGGGRGGCAVWEGGVIH